MRLASIVALVLPLALATPLLGGQTTIQFEKSANALLDTTGAFDTTVVGRSLKDNFKLPRSFSTMSTPASPLFQKRG